MATLTRTSVSWVNGRFIATCLGGYISYSTDQVNWTNINIGTVSNLRSVAYGLGYYIIVGDGGRIARSTDGTTWTITNSLTNDYTHIEFAAGKFVAVGSAGRIIVSTTGTTFTAYTSGVTSTLNRVRYVNALWIAVGNDGSLTSSTTGTAWTPQTIDTRPLYGISYLSTATTYKYTAGKKASIDGVNWTSFYSNNSASDTYTITVSSPTTAICTPSQLDRFAGFIAAHPTHNRYYLGGLGSRGFGGTYKTFSPVSAQTTGFANCIAETIQSLGSSNNTWSLLNREGTLNAYNSLPRLNAEEVNGNIFFGGWGQNGDASATSFTFNNTSYSYILSSVTAGSVPAWRNFLNPQSFQVWCPIAAYGNGFYVMLGISRNSTALNGYHVVARGTTIANPTVLVAYATGTVKFPIDLGSLGPIVNGGDPVADAYTLYPLHDCGMTFGASRFIAVGPRPTSNTGRVTNPNTTTKQFGVSYSTDNGSNWTDINFPASIGYDVSGRVAGSASEIVSTCRWYNNGTLGWVMRSTDGANWTYHYTGYPSKVNEIKYLNGHFYTVHDNGGIARSVDGVTWTTLTVSPQDAIMGQPIYDITYIAGRYVLTSNNGFYQTTTNLSSYVTYQSGGPSGFMLNDGTKLISSAYDTSTGTWRIRTSIDGITWTQQSIEEASDIAYSGTKYIAVKRAAGSALRESTTLAAWSTIQISNITGVGIIIRDSANNIRLQSYNSEDPTYLCARVIQEDYVAGVDSTIYVNGSDGYEIFVVVSPDGASAGGQRIPFVELKRGAGPAFQPYYTVTYPPYGGAGSTVNPANVYCTVFTTGEVEKITY